MAITEECRQAIKDKDVRMVRIMLTDSFVVDPTFQEFNEMLSLAKAGIPDLFDEHDGEALECDKSSWTKDYMDEQMIKAVRNFSKERIDLLKKICKHLYGERAERIEQERKNSNTEIKITKKQVGAGMVVGGAAATAVGIAIAETAVTIVGVAAIVAGGALIISDK